MAKVVYKTTPKAAYEWAEVEGGSTMSHYETAALLDSFIEENGLVPVETVFEGETPRHKFGRYKALGAPALALAPTATAGHESDLAKANAELARLQAELARAQDQLGKLPKSKLADMVEGNFDDTVDSSTGGAQTTESARATLNQQEGVNIVASGEEVREDMSVADRSDDNPVVDAPRRGRPRKAD